MRKYVIQKDNLDILSHDVDEAGPIKKDPNQIELINNNLVPVEKPPKEIISTVDEYLKCNTY